MKLLYSGASGCDQATLKRLLLVGTDLVYMDRPSVTFFGKWGTIGHASMFRSIDTRGEPVTISVEAPPSGPADTLYHAYAVADFDNPEFVVTFLQGLRDPVFASKFIQTAGNYGDGLTGRDILDALLDDGALTPWPLAERFRSSPHVQS